MSVAMFIPRRSQLLGNIFKTLANLGEITITPPSLIILGQSTYIIVLKAIKVYNNNL